MTPKKSLGQNFLISPRVAEKMAISANLSTKDTVLEIGPGKGMLTKYLLSSGAKVIAVEKDDLLIPILEKSFLKEISSGQLSVIHSDILTLDPSTLDSLLIANWKLIANIPYYITGEILRMFLSADNKPSEMILMVQKEVAKRILDKPARHARPGVAGGKESILSLSVKVYGTPSLVMNVSRGNFFPIPNVDSAVIKISNIKNNFETKEGETRFFEIVKLGFAHKRKKLISNLLSVTQKEKIEKIFKDLNIDQNTRPEELPLETWIKLSEKI